MIRRNALRLLKMVNALLDFSRIEAHRVDAVYERTDLAAYTAELASTFRSLIERAGLRFVYEPSAVGVHHYEKAPLEWLRMFRSMGRADVIFARKHPASVDEVMGLSPFPRWPGMSHAIPWLERFVLSRNDRGGRAWGVAAALTQGAHYWEGVEAEARDQRELAWLIGARRRVREELMAAERARRGGTRIQRLLGRLRALRAGTLRRVVARALGRSPLT